MLKAYSDLWISSLCFLTNLKSYLPLFPSVSFSPSIFLLFLWNTNEMSISSLTYFFLLFSLHNFYLSQASVFISLSNKGQKNKLLNVTDNIKSIHGDFHFKHCVFRSKNSVWFCHMSCISLLRFCILPFVSSMFLIFLKSALTMTALKIFDKRPHYFRHLNVGIYW